MCKQFQPLFKLFLYINFILKYQSLLSFRLSSSLNNKLSTTRNGKSNSYASHQDHKAPPPELNTIHRALFSDRKKSSNAEIGNKPLFTVTMPKKGNINSRQTYN